MSDPASDSPERGGRPDERRPGWSTVASKDRLAPRRWSARSGLFSRAGWNFAAQALSSLSNVVLALLIAKATSVDGFGYFAVAFTIYTFLLGVSRALANQPYLMRCCRAWDAQARDNARAGTGLGLLFGAVCAIIIGPLALLVGGSAGPSVAAMALLLPGLLLQDVWRTVFIASQQPRSAAANDAAWTLLQIGGLAAAVALGVREPLPLIVVWGLAGWIAAGLAIRVGRVLPSARAGVDFARKHSDASRYLVAEWLTVLGAVQLALLLVATIGTAADVGSLRAALTLLGPLTILVLAAMSFLVPELASRPALPRRAMWLIAAAVSGVLVVLTLAWGLGLLALPDGAGRAVLGDVWPGARSTLAGLTLCVVGTAVAAGPLTVIRACGESRPSFGVNALIGMLMLVGVPLGFLLGGAPGAAVGFAVGNLVPAPLFWVQLRAVLRRRDAQPRQVLSDDPDARAPATSTERS